MGKCLVILQKCSYTQKKRKYKQSCKYREGERRIYRQASMINSLQELHLFSLKKLYFNSDHTERMTRRKMFFQFISLVHNYVCTEAQMKRFSRFEGHIESSGLRWKPKMKSSQRKFRQIRENSNESFGRQIPLPCSPLGFIEIILDQCRSFPLRRRFRFGFSHQTRPAIYRQTIEGCRREGRDGIQRLLVLKPNFF